jgi:hypothetical protein
VNTSISRSIVCVWGLQDGSSKSNSNPNRYVKTAMSGELLLIILYVDDLIVTSSSKPNIVKVKKDPLQKLQIIDNGVLHYYLKLELCQKPNKISLSQIMYVSALIKKFKMLDHKKIDTSIDPSMKQGI